jgi:hypothetical protein
MKLPPFVHAFVDRHGKPRFYFRKPGYKRAPLPGLPWSPEFMAVYELAKDGDRLEIGIRRTKPGTVAAAVTGYFGSLAFATLAETSRITRRRINGSARSMATRASRRLAACMSSVWSTPRSPLPAVH